MADIYAATRITYGNEADEANFPKDRRTGKVTPVVYEYGDVVDTKVFTKEALDELLLAKSLTRINPLLVEAPELTVDELVNDGQEQETVDPKAEKPKP